MMDLKELEKFVEKMNTSKEEIEACMRRRIRHINFAKALIYFFYLAKRDGFVYPREIAKRIKSISTPRAWQIMNELEKLGFARRTERGGEKVYILSSEKELEKWVEEAMETVRRYEGNL